MPHFPVGTPIWNDIITANPSGSSDFYTRLFGWEAQESGPEYGGYVTFLKDGRPVAGLAPSREPGGHPDFWAVYLASDDAEATTRTAEANGAKIFLAPLQVGRMGTMAMLADSTEAAVGVWQPAEHKGFGVQGVAGSPVWHELHTRDYMEALAFYRTVFNWDTHVMSDTEDFRYSTLGEGDGARAGLMDSAGFLPENVPAHWAVYFGVADTDEAVRRLEELGGSVLRPAEDTPFGRLADVADPNGAAFKISSVGA